MRKLRLSMPPSTTMARPYLPPDIPGRWASTRARPDSLHPAATGDARPGAPSRRPSSRPSRPPAWEWPMVGRERELGVITRARDAGSAAVVVSSSMGLGKSRLAREVLAQAERDGASTVWVQATRSASNVPMGAFAGGISADLYSEDAFEALRRAGQTFRELARARPLVIAVDDAHLLDAASAALVLQLVGDAAAF